MITNTWFTRTIISTLVASLIALGAIFSSSVAYADESVDVPPADVVVVEQAPVVEEPAPVAEDSAAVADESAPVVEETPAPAEEAPVVEETTDTPPVVDDAPAPVTASVISATNPEVYSEKEDYHPTQTATIFGKWFNALTTYVLKIFGSDDSEQNYTETSQEVTTDDTGSFTASYTLDDLYRPFYEVIVSTLGGEQVAATWFRDAAIAKYDQCSNDDGDGYATGNTECRFINGNLGVSNSTYYEGDATIQRLSIDGLAPGSVHTVTLKYGTTKAGKHAYDYLTSWDASEGWSSVADRCDGIQSGCTTATEMNFPMQNDPNVTDTIEPSPASRFFTMRGATITNVSVPTIASGSYAGDSETIVVITYTAGPANGSMCTTKKVQGQDVTTCAMVLWFGAHVAKGSEWAAFNNTTGAGSISGSPYHVALADFDGDTTTIPPGGGRDNQMASAAILAPQGTISGVKFNDVNGNGVNDAEPVLQNWTITLNPGALVTQTDANGIYTFPNLADGVYTVCETQQVGWTQTFPATDPGNCVGGNGYSVTVAGGVNTPLGSLDFGNTNSGHIIVDKVTVPAQDPQSFSFTTTGTGYSGFSLTDQAAPNNQTLNAGTYSVAETIPSGWSQTSVSCTSSLGGSEDPASIQLTGGETVTCTFTNTKQGKILIDKVTNPTGSQQSFEFDPSWSAQNVNLTDAAAPADSGFLAPGSYSVSEVNIPAGWDLTSSSCSDGSGVGSISLQAGETVTCTFTNTLRGEIVLVKNTVGGEGSFDFVHQIAGLDTTLTTVAGTDSDTSDKLVPGDYSISETVPAGWDLTSATCDQGETIQNITVGAGETVTCTFTNTKRGHIVIDKVTLPAADPQSFNFTAGGAGYANFSLTDAAQPNDQEVVPGTYSVSETVPAGWDQTSAVCDSGETIADLDVEPGETVTCTFTNTKRGHIIVDKVTDPAGDAQSFDFVAGGTGYSNFSLTDAALPNDQEVVPGKYSVSETVPAGWDQTSATCDQGETIGDIDVGPGETVTCTFNNQKDSKIIVEKQTLPDGSLASFSFTASYDNDGFSLTDGQQNDSGDLDPGQYSVSEDAKGGWDLTSTVCTSSHGGSENAAAIVLSAGETVTCVFTNTQRGHITVEKQTLPNGSQAEFTFTGDVSGVIGDGETATQEVIPGTYTSTEAAKAGWDLTSIVCDDSDSSGVIGTGVATFIVAPGEDVKCTFTNTQRGHIILEKQTLPDGDTTVFDFDMNYGDLDADLSDGQTDDTEVVPGTYSASEHVPSGWDLTSAVCSDQSEVNAISVQPGETVTCTFTNTKRGHIIIDKVTQPTGDLTSFNFDASGSGYNDFSLADADPVNDQEVTPGTYGVLEAPVAGWDLSSATCSDGSPVASINVAPGETVTCTFTNTKRATLTIVKDADPNDCQDFAFTMTGQSGFSLDDDSGVADCVDTNRDQTKTVTVAPQQVTITETQPNQFWVLKSASCVVTGTQTPFTSNLNGSALSLTLTPGSDVTCTFVNSKASPTRTQGFWQTHYAYTSNIFNTKGPFYIGVNAPVAPGTHKGTLTTIGQVFGAFYSNIAKTTTNAQRSPLDKARMQLLQQLMAAKLNCQTFGCSAAIQAQIANADSVYATGTAAQVIAAAGQMDAYNNSGDTMTIGPAGKADPKASKAAADLGFWNAP